MNHLQPSLGCVTAQWLPVWVWDSPSETFLNIFERNCHIHFTSKPLKKEKLRQTEAAQTRRQIITVGGLLDQDVSCSGRTSLWHSGSCMSVTFCCRTKILLLGLEALCLGFLSFHFCHFTLFYPLVLYDHCVFILLFVFIFCFSVKHFATLLRQCYINKVYDYYPYFLLQRRGVPVSYFIPGHSILACCAKLPSLSAREASLC